MNGVKAKVFDLNGNAKEEMDLPSVFSTPYRPVLIKRAVHALQSMRRQAYGSDPMAGKRSSAGYHGLRDNRFTMMNREMARMARIHGRSASGTYLSYRARNVPQAVKGRKAHPPKAEKNWRQKINYKELLLSLKSALAGTVNPELIKSRGHKFTGDLPIVVDDEFESLKKTRDVMDFFAKKNLIPEVDRCKNKKVRAGKGTMRGRRYKKKTGILIVVSRDCPVKAVKNIAGVDVITVDELLAGMDTELLAPGCQAGRLTIYSKSAIKLLGEKLA